MHDYNTTVNAMNQPGGVLSSRIKRGNQLRGGGEGRTYTKRLGRHEHRIVAEEMLGRALGSEEVVHHIPATNLQTKGESITFSTPTIEGTVLRRNKLDGLGKHPWKAEVTEGTAGVATSTVTGWFGQVYEPVYTSSGA